MTEKEDRQYEYKAIAKKGTRRLMEMSGKLSIFVGFVFLLRVIYSTFTEEIFYTLNLLQYVGVKLFQFSVDFILMVANFATYGYIGPAVTLIILGYLLQSLGKTIEEPEENESED